VLVAVRPEKLRVTTDGRGIRGHLEDFVYLGSRATLVVRLGGDRLLQVEDSTIELGNARGASASRSPWSGVTRIAWSSTARRGERLE
jgi:hypothetical protein